MSCSNHTVDDLYQQQICNCNNEHENQKAMENSVESTWKLLPSAASTPICHYYSTELNVINGEKF
jgi:hypothetical protein